MSTVTRVNTYVYSVNYVADQLLRSLKDLIREIGLDPANFVDSWKSTNLALTTWLHSRHLERITLEIYDPGAPNVAILVPEFEIVYGDGDDDGAFWVDGEALRYQLRKEGLVPQACRYSLVVFTKPGRPDVAGWGPGSSRSRAGMTRYLSGTAIASPGLAAASGYWARG